MENKPLYEQLVGDQTIDIAVDNFYDKMLADPLLKEFYKNTNMKYLRRHQKNFLTFATGGPNIYKGKDMRTAHKHFGLKDIHFNQLKKHLGDTLAELRVDKTMIKQVLDLVETLRAECLDLVDIKPDQGKECCVGCFIF